MNVSRMLILCCSLALVACADNSPKSADFFLGIPTTIDWVEGSIQTDKATVEFRHDAPNHPSDTILTFSVNIPVGQTPQRAAVQCWVSDSACSGARLVAERTLDYRNDRFGGEFEVIPNGECPRGGDAGDGGADGGDGGDAGDGGADGGGGGDGGDGGADGGDGGADGGGGGADVADGGGEGDGGGDGDSTDDGGTAADSGGTLCASAEFDGAGSASLKAPKNSAYDFSGSFTIEAWVKVKAAPALAISIVAGQVSDELISDSYYIGINSNRAPVFVIADASTKQVLPSADAVPLDTWTHVAGVVDKTANTMTLYVNGILKGQQTSPLTPQAGSGLSIGHTKAGASNYQLNGRVDELRLSKVARYTTAFTPAKTLESDADTVGLFHLDEDVTSATPDASATANNAAISGPVTFAADCP